ncbi:LLGL scribble cell polarity complex component 2 [Danio rerio]|uniref:LLGL scribble cell polarity complex component 2 n=2 Tax=Danio rerio TaxID=7955 RepID=L2GL2_DANRE|nr:LLGL scribble cell polarity complex component 2 [Danio rerio]Q7SZE3.1 RecName: Full=LLGL scribble cell polarity complex component 2; AltName: Full=Lethal(2) giant larvae protein homolog 2; AltName: Full=Protein penner [Danio rerio]AAH52919.1 Lethal giant larvae homolog 2 (Drosophila) [Danio rerio]AAI71635.1 Lethal giant larvae homolog 2 (Drosophila) [Danio rerio]|eukprot:NP_997747.1 lethal(2) giant larvae protein homolog 2 [Danio rerio]
MKRFRRHGHESQRDKHKQDLYQFNKTVEHGFPHQPSALGFSPSLELLAIGTRSGAIKLYGAPGVEFMGLHDENAAVTQVHFLPNQVELVTLLEDNSLHMWTLRAHNSMCELLEIGRFTLSGPPGAIPSVTRVTAVLAHSSGELLLLGTEGGHVFVVEVPGFRELEENNISVEDVQNRVPEDYVGRRNLESVETLHENPLNPRQVLIGYSRGLMVLWDLDRQRPVQHFLGTQQLESVWWMEDGESILSSHSDGSYCQWTVTGEDPQTEPEKQETPYGAFPCKAISKIIQLPSKQGPPFLIFSGGMPRASYGDRHCISVIHSKTHEALDFTSRIIDFFVIREGENHKGEPSALVVLVEEELVVVDLQTEGWPVIQTPYLVPLHCSAITCSHHVSSIPLKLWERVQAAGAHQNTHYSRKPWPINGGKNLAPDPPQRDLLLTGHEDGTVRFWDASGVCLYPMYKLSTAGVFHTDADPNDNMNQGSEGEWPPFRKVGCFDPYSDDPRLGIQKIHLCKYSGYLTVAGTAGQILVLELNDEAAEQMVEATVVDLLQGQEGFRWKGQARLDVREEPVLFPPGFQPFALVQCQPPAVVTAIALHSEWKLVGFGTSHGFGLYDYNQRNNIMVKCTLNPSDQMAMEGPLSRVKSIKKSLRQSFRRIRRSRVSMRKHHTNNAAKLQEINARLEAEALQEMELAPVQRKIEARSSDDSFTGLVRTLYFADTFVSDSSHSTPSLWAGTNGGAVFAYVLRVPPQERRAEDPVTAHAAKEIQLMHRAPVVGLVVLDGKGAPLPEPLEVAHDLARSPEMHGSHHLLVVSEEQFKLFTLPKVSSKSKLKLTAVDGSRVRRVGVAWFGSRTDEQLESCLVVLTNQGELHVISLPSIKMLVHYPCIRREDVSGIASCVFTKYGQGFYLISPSEFERFSLSTRWVVQPHCLVEPPLQMRSKSPSSPVHRDLPDGVPTEHRNFKGDSEGYENSARQVMEHALLNDESVLQEIQKSLEGDQTTFLENNLKTKPKAGNVLSNGD